MRRDVSRDDEFNVGTAVADPAYADAVAAEQDFLEERPTGVAANTSHPKVKAKSSEQAPLPGLPSVRDPAGSEVHTRPGTAPLGSRELRTPPTGTPAGGTIGGQSRRTMAYNVNEFREERTKAIGRAAKRTPDRPTPVAEPEPEESADAIAEARAPTPAPIPRHASSPESPGTSSTDLMSAVSTPRAASPVEAAAPSSMRRGSSSRELSRADTEPHLDERSAPMPAPDAMPATPVAPIIIPPTAQIVRAPQQRSKRWFIVAAVAAVVVGSGAAVLLAVLPGHAAARVTAQPAPSTVVAVPQPAAPAPAPQATAPAPAPAPQAAAPAPAQQAPAPAPAPQATAPAPPPATPTPPPTPAPAVVAKPKPSPAKPAAIQRPRPAQRKPAQPAQPDKPCTSLDCF